MNLSKGFRDNYGYKKIVYVIAYYYKSNRLWYPKIECKNLSEAKVLLKEYKKLYPKYDFKLFEYIKSKSINELYIKGE